MKKGIIALAIIVSAFSNTFSQNIDTVEGRDMIFDNEDLFTEEQENELAQIVDQYQKQWGDREIIVVTVKDLSPFNNFTDYARDLAANWQYVRPDDTNSMIIVISKKLGNVRISSGQGTTALLENQQCHGIINYNMMPYLKQGKFFDATKTAVTVLAKNWK